MASAKNDNKPQVPGAPFDYYGEDEKKVILRAYRGLLRLSKHSRAPKDRKLIRKAFDVALDAHKDMRRKSGEAYIFHPIAVSRIVAGEIGLGTIAIVSAMLHDTVEDTDLSLDDVEYLFGAKVRVIIDGLTKLSDVFDHNTSPQAENFRKMLLTLSDDVRVILIKLADRLHNMRTLDSMKRQKQLKIASETLFLFAPLAHRLGLYSIKSELEDLGLKFTEPEAYEEITQNLKKTQAVRTRFINRFSMPVKRSLDKDGFNYTIKGRTKSVYSIYNKIKKQNIAFEEVYDLFAIRIVLHSGAEQEKADCWKAYSIVTDFYQPNPDRLRDWISTPKANGYESLHTTVMSPTGKWVEVQIRTERMDEVAEKGYAAHWRYKENRQDESGLDSWLKRIRDMLESSEDTAIDFIDDFKLNLFSDEIYVFTPRGDLKTLPKGATALDFAFDIHTQVGLSCIGAKVNHKLVPLSHVLKSGDQIEIITSRKQKAKEDWFDYVITGRAKSKIKSALKEEKKEVASMGKEMLGRKLRNLKAHWDSRNVDEMKKRYKVDDTTELYYQIARGKIDLKKLKGLHVENGLITVNKPRQEPAKPTAKKQRKKQGKASGRDDVLIIGNDETDMPYKFANCCNPIPGDDVFGFVTVNDGVKIHRTNCPNAVQLRSNYDYRVIRATWQSQKEKEFASTIHFKGIDDVGLVYSITQTISSELHVNMKSISFESEDGVFDGKVVVYVFDLDHLNDLINKLQKVKGVLNVQRMDTEEV